MPAEVIATVHHLANACKKCKGIVFTDRHGNIINDMLTPDENHAGDITGVYCNIENNDDNTTGVHDDTTGVHDDTTGVHDDTTGVIH